MDKEEFYRHFCTVIRRRGQVKLKNIAALSDISVTQARKFLDELLKEGKIMKVGAGPSTSYIFA